MAPDVDDPTTPVRLGLDREPVAAGGTLGRYVVIARVGSGGMGVVYRAYDPKLQREVALKCLRSDVLSPETKARLVREALAMAKLSHPNVVAVYDVEIDPREGVVLAMEFVPGMTLAQWMRACRRDWVETVKLFVDAGWGLAAAHRAGLLHRDFKPSNVLVSDDGRARVTDFGLATDGSKRSASEDGSLSRASSSRDSEVGRRYGETSSLPASGPGPSSALDVRLTADGRVMGTPAYMAPEQHANQPLDGRADQYAFATSVWQGLTGSLPFASKHGSLRKLAAAKRAGSPTWPKDVGVPKGLADALVRALAPDPSERWPSMDALLEALLRHTARPRRRTSAAVIAALTLLGTGAAIGGLRSAGSGQCRGASELIADAWNDERRGAMAAAFGRTELPYAESAREHVEATLDAYALDWATMHEDACEATAVRAEQSAELMDRRMACLQRARLELRATTDLLMGADAQVVERSHTVLAGLPELSPCADLNALVDGRAPVDPRRRPELDRVAVVLAHARSLVHAGKYAEAEAELEPVLSMVGDLGDPELASDADLVQGASLDGRGRYADAARAYGRALHRSLAAEAWSRVLVAARELAHVEGYAQQRPDAGLAGIRVALGLLDRPEVPPLEAARTRHVHASLLEAAGRSEEAEREVKAAIAAIERVAGPDDPMLATPRNLLALVLASRGRLEQAEAEYRIALGVTEAALGIDHPLTASYRSNLAGVLRQRQRLPEAEAEHRRALGSRLRALGPDHPDVGASRDNLANVLAEQGRFVEAEIEHRAALQVLQVALGPEHGDVAKARTNLGATLLALGRSDEAIEALRAALRSFVESLGPEHTTVAAARFNLAEALLDRADEPESAAEAHVELRRAMAIWDRSLGADHPRAALVRHVLGASLRRHGAVGEAIPLLERALEIRRAQPLDRSSEAATAFELAQALVDAQPERARTLVREAAAALDAESPLRRRIDRWSSERGFNP